MQSAGSADSRTRLQMLGQADLGAWVEVAAGGDLWSIQRRIGTATSRRRSRVAVPSCNASGKTWLAARLALAFYDAYTPGVPCEECGGPCRGSKIITTASKHDHLKTVLWAEIRRALSELEAKGIVLPGTVGRGANLSIMDGPNHFIIGHSAASEEGFQGYHAAHKLILGDEATALDEAVSHGVTGLLASGDSRLLLIFNPTTNDTWAAQETRSPRTEVIKITAWDTPHFTGERIPEGSNLITPEFLEELQDKGMGEGTYEWTTRVCADFWALGDDVLVPGVLYDKAIMAPYGDGVRAMGVDLAPYGSDENVVAVRNGTGLNELRAYPAMRQDLFWRGPLLDFARRVDPHYLIWDADGVGSGVYGEAEFVAEQLRKHSAHGSLQLLPFRGGVKVSDKFSNARSAWWWSLRRRFENGNISLLLPADNKLRDQITDIRYAITDAGDIRVETKKEMRKRGLESPDRADAVMYAFSMLEELPIPSKIVATPLADYAGVKDMSEGAMWRRSIQQVRDKGRSKPSTPQSYQGPGAWDDL